jgi:hypothetical protein
MYGRLGPPCRFGGEVMNRVPSSTHKLRGGDPASLEGGTLNRSEAKVVGEFCLADVRRLGPALPAELPEELRPRTIALTRLAVGT